VNAARNWYYQAMDEKGLGKRLQLARQRAGLTQQDLCHKADLSYSTLAKIERGAIRSPSIFTIQSIAAALGTSLDELIGVPPPKQAAKKQSRGGVRFVYFDINGCLVRFFHGAFALLAEQSDEPADVVEMTFWHYNDQVCRGEMSVEEFDRTLAERLHLKQVDWQRYYLDAIEVIEDMHELVSWVAENYKVGLLTNIMPGFVDAMLRRKLLPNVTYDAIVDSSIVGAIKPEPAIYERAIKLAGVDPKEILLIDDSRSNLMAAEKFGWHVMWFDDYRPENSIKNIREALQPAE
jgi:FMN phosphatase YigB (HAD superfamily)/DNA-binding XRE family transcriptional regulator